MQKLTELIISKRECLIGADSLGNRYYESKVINGNKKKRYIIYKDQVRPEAVPPLWHAWLHYLTDQIPSSDTVLMQSKKSSDPDIAQHNIKDKKLPATTYTRWQPK